MNSNKVSLVGKFLKSIQNEDPNKIMRNLNFMSRDQSSTRGGPVRETILLTFEQMVNQNQLRDLSFFSLSHIPFICSSIELYNYEF